MRLRNESRSSYGTIRIALVLGVLLSAGSARIAAAAAPVFQGIITSPTLCSPRGTAVTPAGDVFVGSDCFALHHMERFNAAGELVATWGFTPRYFGAPNGVAVDGLGYVYVLDPGFDRVLKYTPSGSLVNDWYGGSTPSDVAVDGFGNVYVAALIGNTVRKTTPEGALLAIFGAGGHFQTLIGVAVDASGRVYGADGERGRVVRFLADGTFDMEFVPPSTPSDVAVGPDGKIYVVSFSSPFVYQYSPGGVLELFFESPLGLDGAFRIVIDSNGMIFVTEQYTNRVTKFQIDLATPATPLTFGRLKAIYR